MTKTRVQNERNEPTFYARIPKMCIMDLNPYELALYCNYKQTASDDGYCDKSNTKLAKETHMSVGKVKQAKKSLEDKKLITVQHRRDKSGIENQTTYIKIVDIWQENHLRYALEGGHHMTTPSHSVTTGGSSDNQGVVTKRPQRITSEEKPLKKERRAASKKKDLTELEVWQGRLKTVAPIVSVLLAKFERAYDPAFNTPETYMTLSLLKKYIPYAEELTFLKMTPELLLSLCGEIEPEYKRQNWTFALKTIGEKAPSFMVRHNKKPVTLPPLSIVPPPSQPVENITPEERQRMADESRAAFLAPRQAVGE